MPRESGQYRKKVSAYLERNSLSVKVYFKSEILDILGSHSQSNQCPLLLIVASLGKNSEFVQT